MQHRGIIAGTLPLIDHVYSPGVMNRLPSHHGDQLHQILMLQRKAQSQAGRAKRLGVEMSDLRLPSLAGSAHSQDTHVASGQT
jgi:hypothetical protein